MAREAPNGKKKTESVVRKKEMSETIIKVVPFPGAHWPYLVRLSLPSGQYNITSEGKILCYISSSCLMSEKEANHLAKIWMPRMSWSGEEWEIGWLDLQEIEERSARSEKEAFDCSIEHWKQIVIAGYNEFEKARSQRKVNTGVEYCALCCRNYFENSTNHCANCPIRRKTNQPHCKGTPYLSMNCSSLSSYHHIQLVNTFERASIEELNFLIVLRNELYGNPYETERKNIMGEERGLTIDGKWFSISTIQEALKKYCSFEEKKEKDKYDFKPGDVCVFKKSGGTRIIIQKNDMEKITSVDLNGILHEIRVIDSNYYQYVGRLSDFITEEMIKVFLEHQGELG
jgi:hypothetical protein